MGTFTKKLDLSLHSEVLASPQQVSCEVAEEAVLLSMRNGEYYGLNEVGASIWKLIQQPRRVIDIRDELLDLYSGVDESECEQQILSFLNEMVSLDLAHLSEPRSS